MFLVGLCVLTQFSFFVAKTEQSPKFKVSFICKRTLDPVIDLEYQENVKLITEFLVQMAKKSKNQLLTIEEIITIYKMIMFLYLQDSDDYLKFIEIILGDGEKFKIPYSHDILERLMVEQNNANQPE